MSVNLRYPNITALSEKEQLAQIKSYLHQLVEQLNYSLPNLGSGEVASQPTSAQSENISYSELRAFVIQELQEMESRFDDYIRDSELSEAVEDALEQAKESGEFDGKDGYTPVKGEDYFTEADKAEMVSAVISALPKYNGEVVDV